MELTYKHYTSKDQKDALITNQDLAKFLYQHLDQYGDSLENIQKAIDYVFEKQGGHIFAQLNQEQNITGVAVINHTGMQGYIPENILVYLAVDKQWRGKGLGKKLMQKMLDACKGDIALHVEKDNPAKYLYEKYGFTNPYLEMRLKR